MLEKMLDIGCNLADRVKVRYAAVCTPDIGRKSFGVGRVDRGMDSLLTNERKLDILSCFLQSSRKSYPVCP